MKREEKLRLPGDLVVAEVKKVFQIIKKVEFLDSLLAWGWRLKHYQSGNSKNRGLTFSLPFRYILWRGKSRQ